MSVDLSELFPYYESVCGNGKGAVSGAFFRKKLKTNFSSLVLEQGTAQTAMSAQSGQENCSRR